MRSARDGNETDGEAMRRLRRSLIEAVLSVTLAGASGAGWFLWAQSEYQGQVSCPLNTPRASHPWLIALGLVLASGLITACVTATRDRRARGLVIACATAILSAIAIYVAAAYVLAKHGCGS